MSLQQLAIHIHLIMAYVLAAYAFLSLWLDSRLQKNAPISHTTRSAHKQYAIIVKVMQYITIITLLTGLYRLSFMLKMIEGTAVPATAFVSVYIKIALFLALTGIMGALGSIPLKRRLNSLESGGLSSEMQASTARKLELFKMLQLVLIVIMFGLGVNRLGPVDIRNESPETLLPGQQESSSGERSSEEPSGEPSRESSPGSSGDPSR